MLASSVTKHLTFFSAKIIYAEHICDWCDFKMLPVWQMFPAHFSFKLVHNLFNCNNKEMCLRKSNSLPTSLHFEPVISSRSLQKLVTEMRLSDCLGFFPAKRRHVLSYLCITSALREPYTSVMNTKFPLESGKQSLKRIFFEEFYIYIYIYFQFLSFVNQCSKPDAGSSLCPLPCK